MTNTTFSTPVILNLFQDPSRLHAPKRAVAGWQACGGRGGSSVGTEQAAKWALKQAQGDDVFLGADHA